MALTEHGNTSSHAQLEKAAKEHGIKPIYGCELYTAPSDRETGLPLRTRRKFHQTVLAKDQEGYRNLSRIVTDSWREFFQWPTASARSIREHANGLVVLSGCADSLLSCTLLGGKEMGDKRLEYSSKDLKAAVRVVERYQDVFGENYYLETQRFPGLERTCVLNPAFGEIARITGAKLVASSDVHYPYPDQNEMQRILHAAHRGGTVETADASWEYDILLTYPLSDREIFKDLVGTGLSKEQAKDAILETARIAEKCTVVLPKNEPIKFPYPGSGLHGESRTLSAESPRRYKDVKEYINERIKQGWEFRGIDERTNISDYEERLSYEMGQIESKGFLDYFGMLSDAVTWAKSNKIPVGPARGSAAASLACYLLRITEIDPLQFPTMLFARFIDPNRLDLPDVDLDFADDRRHEVREYLVSVYGEDRVGNIGNFMRYRGKNSIDDIARVYRIPKWAAETVKGLIVERSGGDARLSESLEDTFEMFPKAREMAEQFPQLKLATKLEGNYRGMGVHAAGIVLSNQPISETCAMYTREGKTVVAYDKKDAEYVGMLKADFLGLSTMGVIGRSLEMIGMDLEDLYRVPITEPDTLRGFRENDLVGIFQFEGRATAIINRDVEPENFGHLADINALSRPGPLFSGMTAKYVAVKHGREEPERLHPVVDALTDWTYGQIVYQEQVLSIVKDLAGFPIERVGDIRRIISQKLGQMAMANALEEFIQGCKDTHGISPELARKIWNFIATSSTYSFNQSHSVSYAMLAFWSMYLKIHYPKEFYASSLQRVGGGKADLWKRTRLILDAKKRGIPVLPPDLARSGNSWRVEEDGILGGFEQVPGVGPKTSKTLQGVIAGDLCVCGHPAHDEVCPVEYPWGEVTRKCKCVLHEELDREKGWSEVSKIAGVGPSTVKKIQEFVNDPDPYQVNRVGRIVDGSRVYVAQNGYLQPTHHSTKAVSEWGLEPMPQVGAHDVVWMGMVRNMNFKDVVEATRTRTGMEEEEILRDLKDPHLRKSCVIQAYDDGDEDVYVRVSRWNYPEMEADLEEIVKDQDVILVWGKKREDFGISIHARGLVVFRGE